MKVVRNTYPKYPNVARAEEGDIVNWQMIRGHYSLVRESDGKTLFSTAPVTKEGVLVSNGKQPILTGVVAQVKSKGWVLIISD